jgi:hypothetical protein
LSLKDSLKRKRSPRRKPEGARGPLSRSRTGAPHPRPEGERGGAGDERRRALQPWSRLLTALRAPSSYETIEPNRFGQPRLPTWALREPPRAGPTRGGGAGPSDTPRRWTRGAATRAEGESPGTGGTPARRDRPPPVCLHYGGTLLVRYAPGTPRDTGAKPRHTLGCVPCAEP